MKSLLQVSLNTIVGERNIPYLPYSNLVISVPVADAYSNLVLTMALTDPYSNVVLTMPVADAYSNVERPVLLCRDGVAYLDAGLD